MKSFRVTRIVPYPLGTTGYYDATVRQGYYARAESEVEAAKDLEGEGIYENHFDVQSWNNTDTLDQRAVVTRWVLR